MNVLITGANGFVGKNLVESLKAVRDGKDSTHPSLKDITIFEYDKDTEKSLFDEYCKKADFVFHLAGVNRPKEQSEFMEGNFGFTSVLLGTLKKHENVCPVMISSSTQALLDNPYGKSKKMGENLLISYSIETGASIYIYRFPNIFGKWCKPNYNSAVATFCHNIANNLPVTVTDENISLSLVYIDDVVNELLKVLEGNATRQSDEFYTIPIVHTVTLGQITKLLYSFRESRNDKSVPDMSNAFTKKLYAAYLSYLPTDKFSYPLNMHIDDRGSFTEIIRTEDRGQFSVNISKPGITKGNHWHHTKNEKFLVVSGKGVVRFRRFDSDEVVEYFVSGEKLEVLDIPTGYTHNIENLGKNDMVTLMWCSECFNPEKPDTIFLEV